MREGCSERVVSLPCSGPPILHARHRASLESLIRTFSHNEYKLLRFARSIFQSIALRLFPIRFCASPGPTLLSTHYRYLAPFALSSAPRFGPPLPCAKIPTRPGRAPPLSSPGPAKIPRARGLAAPPVRAL